MFSSGIAGESEQQLLYRHLVHDHAVRRRFDARLGRRHVGVAGDRREQLLTGLLSRYRLAVEVTLRGGNGGPDMHSPRKIASTPKAEPRQGWRCDWAALRTRCQLYSVEPPPSLRRASNRNYALSVLEFGIRVPLALPPERVLRAGDRKLSTQDGFFIPISTRIPCTVRMYGRLAFSSSGSASSDFTASKRLPNAPYRTVIDGCWFATVRYTKTFSISIYLAKVSK